MIELQQDNLGEVIQSKPRTLVQFGAAWCGNCRLVKPKFKKLGEQSEDTQFVYVDAEKFPQSRALAQVTHLPTFALYENGKLVDQNHGNKIEVAESLLQSNQGGA